MKRSKLNPQSKKKRRELSETREARQQFLIEKPKCCVCEFRRATQVHEIYGGSVRQITCRDRRFWLPVCAWCHEHLQVMSKPEQLAHKAMIDPEYYSREALQEVFGGVKVTEVEVIQAARTTL